MKVLSDYDPEKKKKQSPFYRPKTLLSQNLMPGQAGYAQSQVDNPAKQLAQQVAEQKRMNFLSSARLTAEEEFGKAEGSWRESVMGDGSDAGVQPLLDQFNKTADRLLAKAPDDRAKAFVNDSLYGMKMRYAQQADEFTLGKVKEQAGGLLENSLGQSLKQAQSAGPEHLAAIHQNGLTTIHAYGLNGLALDQNTAEARKQKFTSDFWENSVRERAMGDPDQAQQLLDSSRGNLAPDALERVELSLKVGRAERTRKERATKLNTDRQASLLFGNRRETLQAIAETGMDDGSMEKRFTELGRDDLATSWRKERNAAVKLHSFFRETDGTPLLEQARQLGKKFKSSASEGAPEGSMDFTLSALRKRAENFTRDPVGQMAARVQEALGPQANSAEALRMNQRLQRETAKGLPGFRPRVMARDNARQYREMYEEQGGQGRMDVLRGLEPLPTAYRRQALAEAVPGVMPQVAHLALENGRSSKGDMTLWLQAHRPKTGKLEGDPEIEREALANLETSDVFRAVTAPLRMGGGRQGELMLDEFRRGAARYGRLRNDSMAGVRFLEENVRTLQSEGLAEIYWPADKTMPGDLEGRLRAAREEVLTGLRPDPDRDSVLTTSEEDKPTWINAPDGNGFILVTPDGKIVKAPTDRLSKPTRPSLGGEHDESSVDPGLSRYYDSRTPAPDVDPGFSRELPGEPSAIPMPVNPPGGFSKAGPGGGDSEGDSGGDAGDGGESYGGGSGGDAPSVGDGSGGSSDGGGSSSSPGPSSGGDGGRPDDSGGLSTGNSTREGSVPAPGTPDAEPESGTEPEPGQDKTDPDSLEQLHGHGPSWQIKAEEKEEVRVGSDGECLVPGDGLDVVHNVERFNGLVTDDPNRPEHNGQTQETIVRLARHGSLDREMSRTVKSKGFQDKDRASERGIDPEKSLESVFDTPIPNENKNVKRKDGLTVSEREQFESDKREMDEQVEHIKQAIENGEITREEAKVWFENAKKLELTNVHWVPKTIREGFQWLKKSVGFKGNTLAERSKEYFTIKEKELNEILSPKSKGASGKW